MPPRISGITKLDDWILEFYQSCSSGMGYRVALPAMPIWRNLAEIADLTNKSSGTIARRIRRLESVDLLEPTEGKGYYRITDRGCRYLSDDLTEDEIADLREGLSSTD
jgi:hypothetical protein